MCYHLLMKAFTLTEMLVVLAIIFILLAILVGVTSRAKRNAKIIAGGAEIRNKIIDAVGRGAIRKQSQLDEYHKHLQWQIEMGLKAK